MAVMKPPVKAAITITGMILLRRGPPSHADV